MTERWYISGPMSGIPQFNIPLFDQVTAAVRDQGVNAVSPAELDSPEYRKLCVESDGTKLPIGATWGELLGRDVKLLGDGGITGLVLLPGWHHSRGARLEVFVALLSGVRHFYRWSTKRSAIKRVPIKLVRQLLKENIP